MKKVKKVGKLRMGDKKICDAGARHMPNQESGYAAGLLGYFPQGRESCTAREEAKRLLRGLRLSIVLLSIWGVSLLPIDFAYPSPPTRFSPKAIFPPLRSIPACLAFRR